jgi:galactose mutarotase-like enzyme
MNTSSLTTAIRSLIASHGSNKQQLHDLAAQGIKHALLHGDSNALAVTKELITIDHTGVLVKVIRMIDFDLPTKLGRKYALNKARNNEQEALKLWDSAFEEASEKAFDSASANAYAEELKGKIAVNTSKVVQLSDWLSNVADAPSIAMEAVGSAIDSLHKQITGYKADILAVAFLASGSNDYPRLSERDFAAFERALSRMVKRFGGKLPE